MTCPSATSIRRVVLTEARFLPAGGGCCPGGRLPHLCRVPGMLDGSCQEMVDILEIVVAGAGR
jgi:hypothetical protein